MTSSTPQIGQRALGAAVIAAVGGRHTPQDLRSAFEELRSELGIAAASRAWWSYFAAEDAAET